MKEYHEQFFLLIYSLLGPDSYVSGLTVFVAQWLPWIVGIFPFVYEMYLRDEAGGFLPTLKRIYVAPLVAFGATIVIKSIYPVLRPFASLEVRPAFSLWSDPYGLESFPSSHTAFFSALAVTMYLCNPKMGKWFVGFALAIGLARIGAGVHWPLDILGGFAIGVTIGYLVEQLLLLLWKDRAPKC